MEVGAQVLVIGPVRSVGHRHLDVLGLVDGHVPEAVLVDPLLVLRPKLVPLHINDPSRRSLGAYESPQGRDVDPPAYHAPYRGHAGIVPSSDVTLLHEPGELPLAEDGMHKGHAGEGVDANPAQTEPGLYPGVLLVAVLVLGGAQGVSHPLNRVDDGARQVVRRVGRVLGPRSVMGGRDVLPVQHRIAHCAVDTGHVDARPQAPD